MTSAVPPNKQRPRSVSVDGPTRLRPGGTATFFVSLAYEQPLHADYSYKVLVELLADGFARDVVDSEVEVGLRSGERTGRASFALSCEQEGDGRFALLGGDGSSASDGTWHLSARVPDQTNSSPHDGGGGMTVLCG